MGCPYCGKFTAAILPGFNDLATTHPDLADQWHPSKNSKSPSELKAGSGKKVWWLGSCGHDWQAVVASRAKGAGCPYCTTVGRKMLLVGFNDLQHCDPALAAQWHPTLNGDLIPSDVTAKSHTKVWWRCIGHEDHEWRASVKDRAFGYGCPYCTNQKILAGYNDLQTINPDISKQWHPTLNEPLKPTEVAPSGKAYVWWQCVGDASHEWQATVSDRVQGYGCPYCSGNKIKEGFNDLATTHPEIAAEWHPTKNGKRTPSEVSKGSVAMRWWLCPEGHEYRMKPNSRTTGRNCPLCQQPWSKAEKQLLGYILEELPDVEILENDKTLFVNRMELDIYLPTLKIGIEFNGDYWHDTDLFPEQIPRHAMKQHVCDENGVRLVVVWESDWAKRQLEVESQIMKIVKGAPIPAWMTYERPACN